MAQIPDLELKLLLREVKLRLVVAKHAIITVKSFNEDSVKTPLYQKLLEDNDYTLDKLEHYLKQINA